MITKQEFVAIFNANKGKNFIISTNIAVGRGINGVDYKEFVGYWRFEENHYGSIIEYYKSTYIMGVTENCVVLKTINNTEDRWKNGTQLHFIPFSNIDNITFLESNCSPYRGEYPKLENGDDDWNTLKNYQF